ncbi:hypothetical protein [Companilactobacillus farciminis]|uniref:hypothetical protein n=1 Tax=Companilactobacillus farciminis TaxID=1612 RepID=UPI00241C6B38|nr:hypothetical protein [Companilactobacillus farciminis]
MLKTSRTVYLNGTSTNENNDVLANFNANLNGAGTFNISETIMDRSDMDTIEKDFEEFRMQAKTLMKKEEN